MHFIESIFPPLRFLMHTSSSTLVQNMAEFFFSYIYFCVYLFFQFHDTRTTLLKSIDINYYVLSNFEYYFFDHFKSEQEYTITIFHQYYTIEYTRNDRQNFYALTNRGRSSMVTVRCLKQEEKHMLKIVALFSSPLVDEFL